MIGDGYSIAEHRRYELTQIGRISRVEIIETGCFIGESVVDALQIRNGAGFREVDIGIESKASIGSLTMDDLPQRFHFATRFADDSLSHSSTMETVGRKLTSFVIIV